MRSRSSRCRSSSRSSPPRSPASVCCACSRRSGSSADRRTTRSASIRRRRARCSARCARCRRPRDAVPPAQPVRRREGVRAPDDRQLPRGVRPVRMQRDPVQPRERTARARVRHAEGLEGGCADQARPPGEDLAWVPRLPPRLGVRPGLRRSDVADAPAVGAGRLRDRHRRDVHRPATISSARSHTPGSATGRTSSSRTTGCSGPRRSTI